MGRIGKSLLFDTPLLTLDELLEKVDAVSSEDVAELARELYSPGFALGRRDRAERGRFRSALAPVAKRSPLARALWGHRHIRSPDGRPDQGRRLRRGAGGWGRPRVMPSRAPTTWSSSAVPTRRSTRR